MMKDLFAQFLKEKRYVSNLSERTLRSYERDVLTRWMKHVGTIPTKENLIKFVVAMREDGLATSTCNITIRSFNSFLAWLYDNKHIPEPLKIKQLKAEKRIMKTFSDEQMKRILAWKPKDTQNQIRLYVLLCLLADTGLRATEALTLRLENIDWDNLLIKVTGKGKKDRIIPISIELRKVLHRYVHKQRKSRFPSKSWLQN